MGITDVCLNRFYFVLLIWLTFSYTIFEAYYLLTRRAKIKRETQAICRAFFSHKRTTVKIRTRIESVRVCDAIPVNGQMHLSRACSVSALWVENKAQTSCGVCFVSQSYTAEYGCNTVCSIFACSRLWPIATNNDTSEHPSLFSQPQLERLRLSLMASFICNITRSRGTGIF